LGSPLSISAGVVDALMIVSCPLADFINARQQTSASRRILRHPLSLGDFVTRDSTRRGLLVDVDTT
jgi:hypothetical protein